ncbi:MAG: enoyl-CoA hydratase/isomerase family protein [Alphaproteobacteria bacterium]|nr:enoyl-CoA hydratase/isomerase family protein [Alphaproteobacteria bacterium]
MTETAPPPQDGAAREALAGGELLVDRHADGRRWLWLNRPATRNTLTVAVVEAIGAAMAAFEREGARVAVIAGAGHRAFSAGYDIAAIDTAETMPGTAVGPDGYYPLDRRLAATFDAMQAAPFPVIAAIRGWCIGGGFELAMACDLRVAAGDARFRMPPTRLGWIYSLSGLARFAAAAGVARARHMFLTGIELPAARALDWGLVDEIAPTVELQARVDAVVAGLLDAAPLSLAGLKHAFTVLARAASSDADLQAHRAWRARAIASADLAEGRRAFLERRKPAFKGR